MAFFPGRLMLNDIHA